MTRFKETYAVPSPGQVEKEAYVRWERRGYSHGSDREDWLAAERDLTFALNYRTVVRHEFAPTEPVVLGSPKPTRCRFCEQAPTTVKLGSTLSPALGASGNFSIVCRDVCDECASGFRDHLEPNLNRLWERLPSLCSGDAAPSNTSLIAFKALTWLALALMPERDLEYFSDAREWASNADHDGDSGLFSGLQCLAYTLSTSDSVVAWASLETKRDEEASLPSLLFFLASGRFIVQFPVPLGVLDEEGDGDDRPLLRRSWASAESPGIARSRLLSPAPVAGHPVTGG